MFEFFFLLISEICSRILGFINWMSTTLFTLVKYNSLSGSSKNGGNQMVEDQKLRAYVLCFVIYQLEHSCMVDLTEILILILPSFILG